MSMKASYLLLLVFILIHLVLSATCPDGSKLPASCQCYDFVGDGVEIEIACNGASLEELKAALYLIDASIRLEVQLNGMSLQSMPSKIFDGWNVVKLEIEQCDLDSLAEQGEVALSGLENTLEELIITSSFTEENQPTKLDLSHLRRLRELDLSFNVITELGDDWFSLGSDTLSDLILSNNRIQRLGDWAFANLVNLRLLWVEGNRFGSIKRSMLPSPAIWLENLQLDNNAFTSVPDDIFLKMPALTDISLANNGFTHIPESTYESVWSQLMTFDISGNPIECDSHIDWIIEAESDVSVSGTCSGPLGRSGMDLEELIKKKTRFLI
ncbi:hypothetical protein AVEN_275426-1 [Araneus ventricosus]|uniref:Uncharacterized protein n=1 Tax=Araneus ventricosus TaxID=182803 RepID=A0A4Y2LDP2_ARAVE|nr:hypothetical protein AVEN_275426-1 [Araneus ventricosus]